MSDLDRFCSFAEQHLRLEDGRPLVVEDFQRTILADYFTGTTETVCLVSKKNGKSTLVGALALYHLVTTPDAEVVIAAASREQAGILFGQASGFVRRSEWLKARVRPTLREMRSKTDAGRIRVLSSDQDTADGTIPSLAIVDEVARHKSDALYGTLRDGLGPRHGRLIAISTAGDDESSPLGKMRSTAYSLPTVERHGAYRYARNRDGSFVLHEWALEESDDRDDLELVLTANPASWQTIEALRRRHESPSMTPWAWARFACGVWSAGEDGAFAPQEWAACATRGVEIDEAAKGVVIGIDLGWKWDTTAIVPVRREGERIRVHPPVILKPPQDGSSLDAEDIFTACQAFAERWPGCTFAADPEAGGEQLMQRLDRELRGVSLITHSQKSGPMCHASQLLAESIASSEIEHPDDPELNRHVLAAAAKFVGASWRLVKPARKKLPIDGAIALAMAVRVLKAEKPKDPPGGLLSGGMAIQGASR